ncbi:MAG: glycosyltransferase [Cytophagales bacterium]|nr:glycosyltransferase [Rhizobacter sp.]
MNPNPIATVVIPTYQRPDMLRLCLQALAKARAKTETNAVEVIVTDDSRDTRSQQLVATEFPWVHYVAGPRRGPAANRNCGAQQARGHWLIFTDDDCIPDPGWLAAYLRAFGHAGKKELFEGRTRADRQRQSNTEESPVNETGGYLWSCNMALTTRLFRQLGGFCESFPHPAMEDVDMRLRLEQGGQLPVFVPSASVCHPYRPTRGMGFIRQHNASYKHLLERHPQLWQSFTWAGISLNAARLLRAAARNAWQYGLRGIGTHLYAVATKVLIDARFKVLGARLGRPSAP